MIDFSEQPPVLKTNYEREQAHFARMQGELQKRRRLRWRQRVARAFGLG